MDFIQNNFLFNIYMYTHTYTHISVEQKAECLRLNHRKKMQHDLYYLLCLVKAICMGGEAQRNKGKR